LANPVRMNRSCRRVRNGTQPGVGAGVAVAVRDAADEAGRA
jgi:hypothetical protein